MHAYERRILVPETVYSSMLVELGSQRLQAQM